MTTLRIAGASVNQTPLDWENNFNNITSAIQMAKEKKIDILTLPELCITGYGCEDLFLSNWISEKALQQLLKIVPLCENITVVLGLPMTFQGEKYNAACVIENGKIKGFTVKQFLALDGVHYEPRWFKAWKAGELQSIEIEGEKYPFGDLTYKIKGIGVAIEVCEDAWHESKRPALYHCAQGAQLILSLNASHFAFSKSERRVQLVKDITVPYKCAYVYSNLLGNEAGKMIYDGEIIIAQNDRILQQNQRLSFKNVNLICTTIDFENPENSTSDEPFHEDNDDNQFEFAQAVPLALFDYLRKSRSKGFVLSLSGGADSSTCAVLVAEMVRRGVTELGFEKFAQKSGILSETEMKTFALVDNPEKAIMRKILTCAYQGTKNSSEDTLNSARVLAESMGASFHHWNIDEEVESYTKKMETALQRDLTWETDDIALQNIQARARSPIIWMMANIKNALLITTSNRSEGSVGYATMDGDTSGSISPIAGVDKQFIRKWLYYAERELGYIGLAPVNALTPTAELRPQEATQTDEEDLMPYHILLEIEHLAISEYQSPKEVFEQLKTKKLEGEELLKTHIKKFFRLWARNQWKRERLAPSFHVDDYSVDPRSWCRFPILSGGFKEELLEF